MTTALVTGGNRGLGLETCRQLAAAGLDVVLTARSTDAAADAAADLGVRAEQLDVSDPDSVTACARRLQVQQGVDTVVWLATLPDDGPTDGFWLERRQLPW